MTVTDGDRARLVQLLGELLEAGPGQPPRPTDDQLVAEHRNDQRRRGLAHRSICNRDYELDGFRAYIAPRSLLDAQRGDVEAWFDSRQMTLDSYRNALVHLRGFYAWATDAGYIAVSPTAKIRPPKQRRGLPRPIRDEHLALAIDQAPNQRMRCWLLLGAYEGLRCQEIAGLDAEDVRRADGVLFVRQGKGRKQRPVPLHPDVADALDRLPPPAAGPLFTMGDGRRVPPYVVSQRINRFLASLGVPSTAHALRHWFATNIYRGTQDLRLCQELLGHASPATTAIYAACDPAKAAPAVAALSIEDNRAAAGR